MQLFTVFSTVLALLSAPVLGAPPVQLTVVEKYAGATKPNSYIVTLKKGVAKEAHVGWLQSFHGSSSNITHSDWDSEFFHGFAGMSGLLQSTALIIDLTPFHDRYLRY